MYRLISHEGDNVTKTLNLWCSLQDIIEKEKISNAEEIVSPPAEISEPREEILFNPNVFTEFKLAGSAEVNLGLYD